MDENTSEICEVQHPSSWLSDDALVTTPISQRGLSPEILFYNRSIKVKHYETGNKNQEPPSRTGKQIAGFSSKSRSRLRLYATNNSHRIKSQFCLTYHQNIPTDGRISKKHLNAWLQVLRRMQLDIGYLWILEFQDKRKEKAPHYHVFLNIEPDQAIWQHLADAWVRITGESDDCLWWHGPERGESWMLWDIGTGQYLAKYLDKERQKDVPETYYNFGRFWGNSACMKPQFVGMPLENLEQLSTTNEKTGEIYGGKETVLRWLGRLAEKQTRGYSRFRQRVARSSYTILDGIKAYDQIEEYFCQLNSRISGKNSKSDLHERINERGYRSTPRYFTESDYPGAFSSDADIRSYRPSVLPGPVFSNHKKNDDGKIILPF